MFQSDLFQSLMQEVNQKAPLVHCLTNDVVVNLTANVLLAIGASPAMVVAHEEVVDFAKLASALLVNVGTLTTYQSQAMRLAVKTAEQTKTPWVLDPVAAGALNYRTNFCFELLTYRPSVVRANASEIEALAGKNGLAKGADSTLSSDQALESAKFVAQKYQTVVALTGQTDYVTDGNQVVALDNGSVQLTKVTGTGCSLSAMVAAYCAVAPTPFIAACAALSHMAIAGELAAAKTQAIGSFAVALMDELQLLPQNNQQRLLKCQTL
ncbi:hydroxyethylthiazole kinase [Neisseria sp. Ec49-e6-T10]|uniref:hydroxyethylthiazole kinase n=1 Tax=Neisseria sp. Ec49-e6-T10 TaxID=3140744 RepID=UPI003EB82E57